MKYSVCKLIGRRQSEKRRDEAALILIERATDLLTSAFHSSDVVAAK